MILIRFFFFSFFDFRNNHNLCIILQKWIFFFEMKRFQLRWFINKHYQKSGTKGKTGQSKEECGEIEGREGKKKINCWNISDVQQIEKFDLLSSPEKNFVIFFYDDSASKIIIFSAVQNNANKVLYTGKTISYHGIKWYDYGGLSFSQE